MTSSLGELTARSGAMQLTEGNLAAGCIAYQGSPGGLSEELAGSLSPNLDPLPCEQYEDAFLALTGFAADKAVVPIENSLGGSIHEILDLLIRLRFGQDGKSVSPLQSLVKIVSGHSPLAVRSSRAWLPRLAPEQSNGLIIWDFANEVVGAYG